MHFNDKMLHLIMTLLIHGAYMERTKCPEECTCIETLVATSYKAVSLKDFDESTALKEDPEETKDEYSKYLSGVGPIDGLYKLKVFSANNSYKFSQKCREKGRDVRDVFLRNFSFESVNVPDTFGLNYARTKRSLNVQDKVNSNKTKRDVFEWNESNVTTSGKFSTDKRNKNVFSYQITCVGLRDLKSVWIQYLPGPATELYIQKTNFQSFQDFEKILKESSSELSQLTVLSVSDSTINESTHKSHSVKTESTNKREMVERRRHSDFLPFASLQNPMPRSKSEIKISNGKSKKLQVLNLTNATIVYLPRDTFHLLINLQILNLSSNLIEFIENETFGSLVNLLHLDMHNNRLRSLNEIMFKNLTKLIFLDVSDNQLSNIEPSTFQYLLSLNVLNLASNPLSEKQEAVVLLGTGKRLQVVDISKTGLKQIPGTLERSVRILNLMGNFLLSIRCGDLDSYSLLSYLNLKSNKISYVEDDALGRLEFLKNLQISENNLFQIPKILPNNLEILNLSFNNIQNITSSDFLNLSMLKELFLSYNQVSSIEKNVFNSLVHLKLLDLSRNPILALPSIHGRIKLVVLNLSYFTNIPESYSARYTQFPVQSPQSVKHLNLESSPVLTKTFLQDTKTLESFTSLKELNLRFTNLTTIRKDIFSLLPKLSVLKVEGNPWHCSREIFMLSVWLRSHRNDESTEDEDEVNTAHCLTPPRLYKTNLIKLQDKDFEEDSGERKDKSVSQKRTKIRNRDLQIFKSPNELEEKFINLDKELTKVERVDVKVYVNTSKNFKLLLSDKKTETSDRANCCGNSDEKPPSSKNDSTAAHVLSIERVSNLNVSTSSVNGIGFINWSSNINSTVPPITKIKNFLDLKLRQVSLQTLEKAEAVTSKGISSLKKENNSHLSFLILSSVGLIVVAILTFISLYFTRTRRDQSYQRQNQDIEVCSISSLGNELW